MNPARPTACRTARCRRPAKTSTRTARSSVYGGIPNYNGVYNSVPPLTRCRPAPPASRCMVRPCNPPRPHRRFVPTPPASRTSRHASCRTVAQVNRADPVPARAHADQRRRHRRDPVVADRLTGLTIVSENPVYIKGDWNAEVRAGDRLRRRQRGHRGHRRRGHAVVEQRGPSRTRSQSPYNPGPNRAATPRHRTRSTCWYRLAIIGGKGVPSSRSSDASARGIARRLRHRRRRAQLPAVPGRLGRADGELPGLDGDAVLQPAGGRHLQVLHDGVRRRRPAPSTSTPTS